jgi:hypothetical protein
LRDELGPKDSFEVLKSQNIDDGWGGVGELDMSGTLDD